MSTERTSRKAAGWRDPQHLPKGPNGRALCRRCGVEVPTGRRTFCGDECVHQHRLRTDAGYLRRQVARRDSGICAECGVDTMAHLSAHAKLVAATGHLWQADHILPVVEGGGECDLGNLRTLCTTCHRAATAALRRRMAEARRAALRGPVQLRLEPETEEAR